MIRTEEHQLFQMSLRGLFDREIQPHVDAWERAGTFPAHDLFPKLGAAGLFGLEYDEAYGGSQGDHSFTVVAGEELGRIDCGGVPMAIAVQMAMATPALARYGSHELKQRYLAPAIRGDMVASIAVTEADAGSDVAGIRTRASGTGTSGSSTAPSSTSPMGPRPTGCVSWPALRTSQVIGPCR